MGMTWKGEELVNYGKLGAALAALQTPAEAREFWDEYIAWLGRPEAELEAHHTPEGVARANIGYLMGYYDGETQQRVYDLFGDLDIAHPIFGRAQPSYDVALAAGHAAASAEEHRDA